MFQKLIVALALQITLFYTMPTDGVIKMPDECKNLSFCTSDTDYPQTEVDDLLKNKNLMSYEINLNPNPTFSPGIGTRLGEGEDTNEINLCEEVSEEKEIRYIIDEQNNVRVVAQTKDYFMQYFPITRCKSPTPTTEDYLVVHDLGDKLENIQCEENKLDLNFVVLSQDLMSLELARVKDGGVPVGCQCRYID